MIVQSPGILLYTPENVKRPTHEIQAHFHPSGKVILPVPYSSSYMQKVSVDYDATFLYTAPKDGHWLSKRILPQLTRSCASDDIQPETRIVLGIISPTALPKYGGSVRRGTAFEHPSGRWFTAGDVPSVQEGAVPHNISSPPVPMSRGGDFRYQNDKSKDFLNVGYPGIFAFKKTKVRK